MSAVNNRAAKTNYLIIKEQYEKISLNCKPDMFPTAAGAGQIDV
jgi:hypothetical protein